MLSFLIRLALAMYQRCGNQCETTQRQETLEGYAKDSEHVHRWLPIEFIHEK